MLRLVYTAAKGSTLPLYQILHQAVHPQPATIIARLDQTCFSFWCLNMFIGLACIIKFMLNSKLRFFLASKA